MKKTRISQWILIGLLVSTGWVQGQNRATSPEATVQNRVQDIAVNLYTGNPVVGVPLYTFQEGAISIPIGLNYNASGIRGGEAAPWTGLGWTLNAGGMITRLVRGWPDEGTPEGVNGQVRKGYYEVRNSANQEYDHEPDLFIANINGASFKFCFNDQGVIHFFPEADLKVRPITKRNPYDNRVALFSGWEVITTDGTKYCFGSLAANNTDEYEYTITKDAKDGAPGEDDKKKAAPSAWYLRRIETPYGQSITIQYARIFYSYLQLGESEWNSNSDPQPLKVNRVYVAGYIPGVIIGSNSTVVFNKDIVEKTNFFNPETNDWEETVSSYNTGDVVRQDVMAWQGRTGAFSRILKNMCVLSGGKEVCYNFSYDYFTGYYGEAGNNLPNGYSFSDTGPTHLKRLKLTGVAFPDGTTATFNYHAENNTFPGTLARGVDHWGYLNGNHGATHLIGQGECQGPRSWSTVNRTPTLGWNVYGTLQKITYSTGSETELAYENNVARNYGTVGGLRIRRIATRDVVTGQYSIREYEYNLFDSGTSSGFLWVKPVYRFDYPNNGGFGYNSYLYPLALAISGRPIVGYRNVKEIMYGGSINTDQFNNDGGYRSSFKLKSTKYTFDQREEVDEANICDGENAYSYKPWWYRPFYDYQGGNMLRIEERAKNDVLSMVKEYEYDQSNAITTYNANRVVYYNGQVGYQGGANYTQAFYRYSLKKETTFAYDQNGSNFVRTEMEYTYKDKMEQDFKNRYPGKHTQPSRVRTLDAQGVNVFSQTLYVADFDFGTSIEQRQYFDYDEVTGQLVGSGYYDEEVENIPGPDEPRAIYDMKKKNMDAMPVESYTVRNGQILSASRMQYQTESGRLRFAFQLRYFPISEGTFTTARWQSGNWQTDTRYQLTSTVEEYNSLGMPTSVKPAFGARLKTEYGYNNLLPTKVIRNADLENEKQEVKYSYDVPMFGVTREEAPNGFATVRDYENGTGRLQKVKDQNNRVLKHYEYKAKGQ